MATFDVRKDVAATTTCILFADETVGSTHVAYQLTRFGGEHVVIGDSANDEFEVCMMNGDKLESFYTSPYEGKEGFFSELLDEYSDMHGEDKEWFRELSASLGLECLSEDE